VAAVEEYKATFELIDVDGDGYISAVELKSLMHALGREISDSRAVEIVVQVDGDRNGKISLPEFAELMSRG
jgi:Ca2+-binding EF-hand superfamily protein